MKTKKGTTIIIITSVFKYGVLTFYYFKVAGKARGAFPFQVVQNH